MTTQTETNPKISHRKSRRADARDLSDLFCLWRMCGKPACRRAHACKGEARACLRALPLVPPEALLFLKGMDEGRGWLTYDEMMARNEEEWAAVEGWHELVRSTLPESDVWSEPQPSPSGHRP